MSPLIKGPDYDPKGLPPQAREPTFDKKYLKALDDYFVSMKKTHTLAKKVHGAKKQGVQKNEESELRKQLYKTRDERRNLRKTLQFDSPAELIVHYTDKDVYLEGTARDWTIANYHLTGRQLHKKAGTTEFALVLDKNSIVDLEYEKKITDTEEEDTTMLINKGGYATCIYGTPNKRYIANVLIGENNEKPGTYCWWDDQVEPLGKRESIRALEKYILKNPEMNRKIRLIPKWEGGGTG